MTDQETRVCRMALRHHYCIGKSEGGASMSSMV